MRLHPHAAGRSSHLAMQVHHDAGAGVEPHHAQAPGQTLAEVQVVAVRQRGHGQQLACAALQLPGQLGRQAAVAGLARRVLHGAAVGANLQREAAFGRRSGEAQRHTAACGWRQVDLRGAQHRVLARGLDEGHGHGASAGPPQGERRAPSGGCEHTQCRTWGSFIRLSPGSPPRCTGSGRRSPCRSRPPDRCAHPPRRARRPGR